MTPDQILTLPNTIHHITIFLNIPDTLSLAETCKTLNHIINTDTQFIFIKCIYIIFNYRNKLRFYDWVSLIQSSRYNYYKIIPSDWLLFDTEYPIIKDDAKEYYKQIQNDPVVTYPKYYNELYSELYYNVKYEYECENKVNWYELDLDKLIEHYKNNKKYQFADNYEPVYLPLKSIAKFENIEFAKKLKILITNNHNDEYYIPDMLRFKYNNIIGIINKTPGNIGEYLIVKINNTKFRRSVYYEKLFQKLRKYLQKNLQINKTEAELFANFIINKSIIDTRRKNYCYDDNL